MKILSLRFLRLRLSLLPSVILNRPKGMWQSPGWAGAGVLHHGSGEENCCEKMLLDTSESDDVLDANDRGNGIWERR